MFYLRIYVYALNIYTCMRTYTYALKTNKIKLKHTLDGVYGFGFIYPNPNPKP